MQSIIESNQSLCHSSQFPESYSSLQIIIMRKKIPKLPSRKISTLPRPILTFDNTDYSHPLFQPSPRKVTIFSAFSKHITIMRASAAQANTVCLASNQLGLEGRMIAIHRRPIKDRHNIKWICEEYNNDKEYDIYSEPEVIAGEKLVQQHEESISMPFLNFQVKRYSKIAVKFKNEISERQERVIEGGQAFAFQQSLEQLDGTLVFDWRVNHGKIFFQKQASEYFPKSTAVIQEYVADLKKVFNEYPELLRKAQSFQQKEQANNPLQDELLPFQSDYFRRLCKHYGKEMQLLALRLEAKSKNRVWKEQKIDVKILK